MRTGLFCIILAGITMSTVSSSWAQTVTVCSGEYERACQAHESYVYCYTDLKAWATNFCRPANGNGDHTILHLNTYGGNKCGYSIDRVICK